MESANEKSKFGLEALTVIVVTFNSRHCIQNLVPTLANLPHVVIVDNASDDDTVDVVAHLMPRAEVLVNPNNLGFGAANNIALRNVTTPYALILNPDCVPGNDFFEAMMVVANVCPDAAIISPDLEQGRPNPHALKADEICCIDNVSGAAMLFNMAVMREVGFFDERFFLYYEDTDLCRRTYSARKAIVFVPTIKLTHLARGSVRGKSLLKSEYLRGYHHAQSKLIYEEKHSDKRRVIGLRLQTLVLAVANLLIRALFPQPRYLARLWGRIHGLISYKRQ